MLTIHRPAYRRTASLTIPLAGMTWGALKASVAEAAPLSEIPDEARIHFRSPHDTMGKPAIELSWDEELAEG